MKLKRKVARILALVHLLGLTTIACGAAESLPLGFIILSAIFFMCGGMFWSTKGGLFE